jgi:hypothetical protein
MLPISHAENQSITETKSVTEELREILGITYFSTLFGPGLHPDQFAFFPNQLGNPDSDGVFLVNQVSFRFKFSKDLALDFQTRFKFNLNNYTQTGNFSHLRWEAPRIGLSGKLLTAGDWTLIGAVNTDFPYFLPPPLTVYQAVQRTVIFAPGMFASLRYEPKESKWSFFSVLSPRYFLYKDRNVAEPQNAAAGFLPQNKPELIIALQPTLNYALTPRLKFTLGTVIDYRKQVISNWNILDASIHANGSDPAWRLNAIPINLGVTYTFGPALTIFPYISTFPIAAQRVDVVTQKQATLLETTSVGMWISGTLF